MINKEDLKKQVNQIHFILNHLYGDLERIWEAARNHDLDGVKRYVDSVQNYSESSISDVKLKVSHLLEDVWEVVEQNEKAKDLDKLLDLQMAFDQIQADVKRWDKILHPENHRNE